MAGAGAASTSSLKEYLKRYESNSVEEENKKKKKKKKKPRPNAPSGVLVVDEDPVWRKPVVLEEEEDEGSQDEDKPIVDEDIEVKRMRRLEQVRARMALNPVAEDGSGWVTLSPKRKTTDAGPDISPPRKRRIRNDTPSPEPGHLDSLGGGMDLSSPRQRRVHHHIPSSEHDQSPVRSVRGSYDMSPPRRRRRSSPDQASDLSPPRKSRRDVTRENLDDFSPPRKSNRDVRRSGFDNLSPPRSHSHLTNDGGPRASVDQDISPPRKNRKESAASASSKEQPKTGLITGRDMRDEILRTRKEDLLRFEQMDSSVSGRGAGAVYRDKKGNRISKDEYLQLNQKVEEKPKEIKIEWGKGLAQKREAEAKLLELELEKEKPFARTRDDAELDTMLKERVRWGDPMAHLVKKKHSEAVLPDLGDNEKMKESGFIIPQDIPSHSWIRRGLDAAPNRYGIKPGRHWDGVDRSTGFEKQMFKRKNEKQATEREAYLWSVSDM